MCAPPLLRSLVGAMRTCTGDARRDHHLRVAIPGRGDEDRRPPPGAGSPLPVAIPGRGDEDTIVPPYTPAYIGMLRSLVGAMRTRGHSPATARSTGCDPW